MRHWNGSSAASRPPLAPAAFRWPAAACRCGARPGPAPKLILADEPTGNLDTANGEAVMDLLTQLVKAGTTVAMVTHSRDHAGYAERTLDLLDGQVVAPVRLAA